jgi:hypothetical protein
MRYKLLTLFPHIYMVYCIIGLLSSFFNIESNSIVFPSDIIYWSFNSIVICCLVKNNKYTWYILLTLMTFTFPLILRHDESYYNSVVFTMTPVLRLPLSSISIYAYHFAENAGVILQLILIIFLLLKNTRQKYNISSK